MNKYDDINTEFGSLKKNANSMDVSYHDLGVKFMDFANKHGDGLRQALSVMSQLTEARKETTEGEWHKVGLPWNHSSPYIIAGHHDPHVGKAILDVVEQDSYSGEDDADIERQQEQDEHEQQTNCDFICLAAKLTREE